MALPGKVRIVEAITAEPRRIVCEFRYRIFIEEMKVFPQYADHSKRQICEPLDKSGHILSASNCSADIIGTVRFNVGVDENFGIYTELFQLSAFAPFFPRNVSTTTKLMVAPNYRRGRLALELASLCYRRGLELGACFDFIDCQPPRLRFYKHLGYRQILGPVRHPEYGDVIPLILVLHYVDHLRKVGSPFAEIGRRFEDRLQSVEFFRDSKFRVESCSSPVFDLQN